jgi:hypothetical protein
MPPLILNFGAGRRRTQINKKIEKHVRFKVSMAMNTNNTVSGRWHRVICYQISRLLSSLQP